MYGSNEREKNRKCQKNTLINNGQTKKNKNNNNIMITIV